MRADVLCVIGLEITEARELKQDDNGHHFTDAQRRLSLPMAVAIRELFGAQVWFKLAAELVAVKEQS